MKYSSIALLGLMASVAVTAAGQGIATSAAAGSSSSSTSASSSTTPVLQQHHPRYQLRKSDSLDVDFAFSPELNQTVTVQPDGYVTLKEVGSIVAEGLTVPELTETLKTAYAKILHDPVITIVLKGFEKPYFIASGQVGKPGKYDLLSPITVTEAVAIAGGFKDSSKHSQVVLFRPMPNGVFESKVLNIKKLLATRNLSEDMYMQPGDMLYVPQNTLSKIQKFIPNSSMGAYYNPAVL
jgi:polysaccharide export outer membrane protein